MTFTPEDLRQALRSQASAQPSARTTLGQIQRRKAVAQARLLMLPTVVLLIASVAAAALVSREQGSVVRVTAGPSALAAEGMKRVTPDGLAASFGVPLAWEERPAASGFDFVYGTGNSADGFLLATRTWIGSGSADERVERRRTTLSSFGATAFEADQSEQLDGREALRLRYRLPSQSGEVFDTEYDVDLGDGTALILVIGSGAADTTSELVDVIVPTITIDDAPLAGIEQRTLTVEDDGVAGRLDLPVDPADVGVVVIGGFEGGVASFPGIQLARAGYPAVSVAYFGAPGVPDDLVDVPLEYFARAAQLLTERADVRAVVLWGSSRGSEAALLAAGAFPNGIDAVVANAPANLAFESPRGQTAAWTLRGKRVEPQSPIPVERVDGPVLLTCGRRDAVWDSCAMAQAIIDRLDATGFPHAHRLIEEPDGTHFVNFPPFSVLQDPTTGEATWRASLDFLAQL